MLPLVAGGARQHLAGGGQVVLPGLQLAGALDDRLELAVALGHRLVPGLVGDQVGVTEARLDVEELLLQLCEAFEHDERGYCRGVPVPRVR